MDEDEKKAIEEEWNNDKFQAGVSFAINQMRELLANLENEMMKRQMKK